MTTQNTSIHLDEKNVQDYVFKRASIFTILTVNFIPNLPLLKSDDYKALDEFVLFAKIFNTLHIKIVGYTAKISKNSDENFSKELSLKRAQAVKDYLIKNGIEADRIIVIGNGSKYPFKDNNTKEGQSLNRRAELSFIIESK